MYEDCCESSAESVQKKNATAENARKKPTPLDGTLQPAPYNDI
jgi:hypothetical protein